MLTTLTILSRDQGPKWQPQWDDRRDEDAGPATMAPRSTKRRSFTLATWLRFLRPLRGA